MMEREIVRVKTTTAWPISLDQRRNLFGEICEVISIILSFLPLNIQKNPFCNSGLQP